MKKLYDFRCHNCNMEFEKLVKDINKIDEIECNICKTKGGLERLFTNMTFHLKGDGYYSTDNREEHDLS